MPAAQGSQVNAKADTVYLALGGALATDLSQEGVDLTAATGGGYQLNASRAALTEQFEVYVRCVLTSLESNTVLVAHHKTDISTATFLLGTDPSGKFYAFINALSIVWTGPNVPDADCSVAWHMRLNPDATGAGDARISEWIVFNHTTGEYLAMEQRTHAAPTTANNYTLSVGGIWSGAALLAKPATAPTKVRVSKSKHTNVEFGQDWDEEADEHTHTLEQLIEPIGAGAETGAQGNWAGAANVGFAAAHAFALRGRTLAPLINQVFRDARELSTTPDPTAWMMPSPGGGTFLLDATLLRWLTIEGFEYAQVRVHVQSWVTTGTAVRFDVRVIAMNRPHIGLGPQLGGEPMPALEYEFVEAALTVNHGDEGEGEWLELGALRLPAMKQQIPGWENSVTLGLGYVFDRLSASGNDANARAKIKAWQVLPIIGEP
jgi:hypothetical protein